MSGQYPGGAPKCSRLAKLKTATRMRSCWTNTSQMQMAMCWSKGTVVQRLVGKGKGRAIEGAAEEELGLEAEK